MLKQVTNLLIPKTVPRKPVLGHKTYKKFGFVVTLCQSCDCPRCGHYLSAGPNHQCRYCDQCGQRVDCSNVKWEEEIELGYAREDGTYEPIKDRVV